jgi:hypothetical protein
MTSLSETPQTRLRSQRWTWIAGRWPFSKLLNYLALRDRRATITAMAAALRELDRRTQSSNYSQATSTLLQKPRRTISKLSEEASAVAREKGAGNQGTIRLLNDRYQALLNETERLLTQDQRWRELAARIRVERTELWEEATRWAPAWQKTVIGYVAKVDDALHFAPRSRNTEDELQRALQCIRRLRDDLAFVQGVNELKEVCDKASIPLGQMNPIPGSYLQNDLESFRETLKAGHDRFLRGEYNAAHRHLLAARKLAEQITLTDLAERRKRQVEALRWLDLLKKDEQAGVLPAEISTVLSDFSNPEFLKEWEQIHRKIDMHILARAFALGNHDQKLIAERFGTKPILKWSAKLDFDELAHFAETVVGRL